MYWNNKTLLIAASLVLLAGVGTAAWFHTANSDPLPAPAAVLASNAGGSNSTANGTDGYYPSIPPPVYMRQPQLSHEQRVADDRDVDDSYVEDSQARIGPTTNAAMAGRKSIPSRLLPVRRRLGRQSELLPAAARAPRSAQSAALGQDSPTTG